MLALKVKGIGLAEKLVEVVTQGAREKKASRLILLDLRGKSDLSDFQLICSGDSERQTRAIAEGIQEQCSKTMGLKPASVEGKSSGHWILLDYGSVIVHIFLNQIRDYYALESLWPDSILPLPHASDRTS